MSTFKSEIENNTHLYKYLSVLEGFYAFVTCAISKNTRFDTKEMHLKHADIMTDFDIRADSSLMEELEVDTLGLSTEEDWLAYLWLVLACMVSSDYTTIKIIIVEAISSEVHAKSITFFMKLMGDDPDDWTSTKRMVLKLRKAYPELMSLVHLVNTVYREFESSNLDIMISDTFCNWLCMPYTATIHLDEVAIDMLEKLHKGKGAYWNRVTNSEWTTEIDNHFKDCLNKTKLLFPEVASSKIPYPEIKGSKSGENYTGYSVNTLIAFSKGLVLEATKISIEVSMSKKESPLDPISYHKSVYGRK